MVGRHGDAWKVRVAAPPERGRANDEVVGVIAQALGVDRRDVRLVGARRAATKSSSSTGLTLDEAERRLAAVGGTP